MRSEAKNADPLAATLTLLLAASSLPDSIRRVGESDVFPNEYPGQIYAFNWCLNGDGVTPLRKSAFRITKPLDLKVAGLTPSSQAPLKVRRECVDYLILDGQHSPLSLGQTRSGLENPRSRLGPIVL